jgi:hypothetical protein
MQIVQNDAYQPLVKSSTEIKIGIIKLFTSKMLFFKEATRWNIKNHFMYPIFYKNVPI